MSKRIVMIEKRFGYFPQRFTVNGKEFTVTAVERCWTEKNRLIFQVVCAGMKFRLIQFVKSNRWTMEI